MAENALDLPPGFLTDYTAPGDDIGALVEGLL